MDNKENQTNEAEQNLFALASKEINEEENNNKDTTKEISFENLFEVAKESMDLEEEQPSQFSEIEELPNEEQSTETKETSEEINPFLNAEISKEEEQPTEIKETSEEINPFLNAEISKEEEQPTETKETLEEINPFLNVETPKEEEQPTETTETSEEVNPFLNAEISKEEEQPTETTEASEEINPFLNVETPKEEVQSTEIKETSEEVNPFLNAETLKEEVQPIETKETSEEINPFLNAEISKEEEQLTETKETSEEVNPFFANKTIAEQSIDNINPFFQNNIELNEKNIHQASKELNLENVPHYNVKIEKKKPKKMKVLLGILSYAVFIWLLLIGIALLIYVGNIKLKEMKGDYTPPKYNAYVVLTGSMLPKIKVEDVVVTKKTDAKDLKEGDIITFASSDERYAGTIITHRIIKTYYDPTTKKYTFESKGDNNNVADNALVEEQNIYGKVILKIPKLGYLQLFLASKGGWILVILIPCAVVISFDIVKLFKVAAQKRKFKIVK